MRSSLQVTRCIAVLSLLARLAGAAPVPPVAAPADRVDTAVQAGITFLLTQLKVGGTRAIAEKYAPFVASAFPTALASVGAAQGPEDVTGLSD